MTWKHKNSQMLSYVLIYNNEHDFFKFWDKNESIQTTKSWYLNAKTH